jgi:hypothetical protein
MARLPKKVEARRLGKLQKLPRCQSVDKDIQTNIQTPPQTPASRPARILHTVETALR